jgi:hypothetical protein
MELVGEEEEGRTMIWICRLRQRCTSKRNGETRFSPLFLYFSHFSRSLSFLLSCSLSLTPRRVCPSPAAHPSPHLKASPSCSPISPSPHSPHPARSRMKAVLQRVTSASVTVDGRVVSSIGRGASSPISPPHFKRRFRRSSSLDGRGKECDGWY